MMIQETKDLDTPIQLPQEIHNTEAPVQLRIQGGRHMAIKEAIIMAIDMI